jgi:hypothetical protein
VAYAPALHVRKFDKVLATEVGVGIFVPHRFSGWGQ